MVIRWFRESFPEFPKGKLVKDESPDFRLWISTRKFIGIELTQVHQGKRAEPGQSILCKPFAADQVLISLEAKEEKIRLYRGDYPHKLWLIIFAEYSEPDAMIKVSDHFRDHGIESSFDKVFIFDLDTRLACELK